MATGTTRFGLDDHKATGTFIDVRRLPARGKTPLDPCGKVGPSDGPPSSQGSTRNLAMALGRRQAEQQELWIATTDLPKSPGHPFYRALNRLLAGADFDRFVEGLCEPYYAQDVGRPGIPPGGYFRMRRVGYFEGIGSPRGVP